MKTYKQTLRKMFPPFLLLFACIFVGCSKDDDGIDVIPDPTGTPDPTSTLLGVWKYADSIPFDFKYLEFNSEELTLYREDPQYKFRDQITGPYQSTDSTFTFGDLTFYTLSGDSLVLSDNEDGLLFIKDRNFNLDDWAKPATVNDSLISPINTLTDFDFRDQTLWMGGGGVQRGLYRIDPGTEKVVDTLLKDVEITAFRYFSHFRSFFSKPNNDIVYEYSRVLNQTLTFSDVSKVNAPITGIELNKLGYFVANDEYITKLNGSGDAIEAYDVGTDLKGLTLSTDHLYACTNKYINVCSLDPFVTVATYRINEIDSLGGIAFTSTHFWVSGKKKGDDKVSLYKVTFPE